MNVSKYDIDALKVIRKEVTNHITLASKKWDKPQYTVLDIAPDEHGGANSVFNKAQIKTAGLSGCDVKADITKKTPFLDNQFDCTICTEVLEHTLNPFSAVWELYRITRSEVYATTPYNFRIHGPLPDCWRFTEHGLRQLFSMFSEVEITWTDSDRFLAPLHYQVIARK